MTQPTLLVLAGPNGAGKTTFAYSHLRDYIAAGLFLNADETAREINPENVETAALAAGRQVLEHRRQLIAAGDSFCIETTLATRTLGRRSGKRGRADIRPASTSCSPRHLRYASSASSFAQ